MTPGASLNRTNSAKALGRDVIFYRSTKQSDGKWRSEYITKNNLSDSKDGQAPEGFWKDDKLYIDVNAGMNGEGLILFTAAHEIVHMIREGSPEQFKALADFLVENYAKKGVDVNKLVLKEMSRSTNLNYDAAYEEVIARASEGMLRDTHLNGKSEKLYKQNRTLWEKIKDAFNSLVSRIKKAYGIAMVQSEEAELVSQWDTATIERAQDLWLEGVTAAAKNLRNMEKPTEGRAKLQSRYAKQGGKFANALTTTEWGIFHSSAMQSNQRNSFRIGNDGIVLHGDKFSKVIYYEDVDGDLEVKAVYKVENTSIIYTINPLTHLMP